MINLDTGTVVVPPLEQLPQLPADARASFLRRGRQISWDYELETASSCAFRPEKDNQARLAFNTKLTNDTRELYLQLMVDLFGNVRRHIVFDLRPHVFSMEKFLSEFPQDSHTFYRDVFAGSSFRTFQRSRAKRERDFFDIRAARGASGANEAGGRCKIGRAAATLYLPPLPSQLEGRASSDASSPDGSPIGTPHATPHATPQRWGSASPKTPFRRGLLTPRFGLGSAASPRRIGKQEINLRSSFAEAVSAYVEEHHKQNKGGRG